MPVTDDTRALDGLTRRLAELGGLEVRVGVLQPDPTRDGDTTIAVVAAAHEFGARSVPQRPFIGPTLDEQAPAIHAAQAKILDGVVGGTMDPDRGADLLGLQVASAIRETIRSNVPPPLSPATIRRKKDTRTLVDTGQLLNSIKHEVGRRGAGRRGERG